MAKIGYNNKSQTAPYDSAKWNAQDANEVKTSVNALYDIVSGITGSPITDEQLVEKQLIDGDNGFFRSGEISIPVQDLIDFSTPFPDVKISGVYGEAKIVVGGAAGGIQTIQSPVVVDRYVSADELAGVFFSPLKAWDSMTTITVYTNIIAKPASGISFGLFCGSSNQYYRMGSATDILVHGSGSTGNISGVTPSYPNVSTPIGTGIITDDVVLSEYCGEEDTLKGTVSLANAKPFASESSYRKLGKDYAGVVANPNNANTQVDLWKISELSVVLYIPKTLTQAAQTFNSDKIKFQFVIEHS